MSKSSRRGQREREGVRRDWWIAGVAATGLVVAAYLAFNKVGGGSALFCTAGSGCDIVQASRYALFLGLPTAAWGATLYAGVGALALFGLTPRHWLYAFLLAVSGASFSLYLTYLSIADLGATCAYCLTSTGIAIALVGLLLARRPPVTGRRSWIKPQRLATAGVLTALVTVVFGAGVFSANPPSSAPGYQEALARHLTTSGAVMYGAFW